MLSYALGIQLHFRTDYDIDLTPVRTKGYNYSQTILSSQNNIINF